MQIQITDNTDKIKIKLHIIKLELTKTNITIINQNKSNK